MAERPEIVGLEPSRAAQVFRGFRPGHGMTPERAGSASAAQSGCIRLLPLYVRGVKSAPVQSAKAWATRKCQSANSIEYSQYQRHVGQVAVYDLTVSPPRAASSDIALLLGFWRCR